MKYEEVWYQLKRAFPEVKTRLRIFTAAFNHDGSWVAYYDQAEDTVVVCRNSGSHLGSGKALIVHEFAHALEETRRKRKRNRHHYHHHGRNFYNHLLEVVDAVYRYPRMYNWKGEYPRLKKWAEDDGYYEPK